MKITIELNLDDEKYRDCAAAEASRILFRLVERIDKGGIKDEDLRDGHALIVGSVSLREDPTPLTAAYIQVARDDIALPSNDSIEVYDDPKVSENEDGAFVQAWVWVSRHDSAVIAAVGEPEASDGK